MDNTFAEQRNSFLAAIDAAHHVDIKRYCKKENSLANLRHNCAIMGSSERHFIARAEVLGYRHEYRAALDEARTQADRYLLLKKLFDKGLVDTFIFRACIAQIGQHALSDEEFRELRRSVAIDEGLVGLVEAFKYFFDQKKAFTAKIAANP